MKLLNALTLLAVSLPITTASYVHQRCFGFDDTLGSTTWKKESSEIILKAHTNTTALFYPLSLYHNTSLPRLIDNTVAHSSDSGISFCTKEAHEQGLYGENPVGRFVFDHTPEQSKDFTEMELTSGEIARYPVHTHGVHCVVVAQSGKQDNWPPAVRMHHGESWQSAELDSYGNGNMWVFFVGMLLLTGSFVICQILDGYSVHIAVTTITKVTCELLYLCICQAPFVWLNCWLSFYNVTASVGQRVLHFVMTWTEQFWLLCLMSSLVVMTSPFLILGGELLDQPEFQPSCFTYAFLMLLTIIPYLIGSLLRLGSTLFDLPPCLDGSMKFLLSCPWVILLAWVLLVPLTFIWPWWNSKEFAPIRTKYVASYIGCLFTFFLCLLTSIFGQMSYHRRHNPDSNWHFFYSDTALWHWWMGPQYAVEYDPTWDTWLGFLEHLPTLVYFFLVYIGIFAIWAPGAFKSPQRKTTITTSTSPATKAQISTV